MPACVDQGEHYQTTPLFKKQLQVKGCGTPAATGLPATSVRGDYLMSCHSYEMQVSFIFFY